jgi:hypothetical protein
MAESVDTAAPEEAMMHHAQTNEVNGHGKGD